MINETEFEDFVYKLGLENAISFKGSANPKALLGKIIPKFPEMKKEMSYYMQKVNNIVQQINNMNETEQKKHLLDINPKFFEKKEKPKKEKKNILELPELENIENYKKIILRTEPAPSGYLHLGHTFNIIFNYEYKKKYNGKFICRFGDTNPDNIKLENYKRILEDVNWLTDNGVDEIYYQSDRLNIYYKYLRQLIELENAYVCKCQPENFKQFNDNSKPCPHRNLSKQQQIENLEKMFNGELKQGEAVVRFKADLENKNPALRDFPIARINENEHARVGKKYRVWPMMNLTVSVDDSEMGLTHIIRGKDHEINKQRQIMILKALGKKNPEYYHIGRMKFEDVILSKTELTNAIKEEKYTGWDDPRVPTILSYRKRGYKAEAFRHLVLAGGISKRDKKITSKDYHKALDFYNKQILETEADRFSFVYNPKEIEIENEIEIKINEINLPKHPELKNRGTRKFKIQKKYLIDGVDFDNLNIGDNIRLMHFANFEIIEKTDKLKLKFLNIDYDKNLKAKVINFIPLADNKKCTIIMQDNSKLKGLSEDLHNPKPGKAIQFERFGFVKFDHLDENGNYIFYFTQK